MGEVVVLSGRSQKTLLRPAANPARLSPAVVQGWLQLLAETNSVNQTLSAVASNLIAYLDSLSSAIDVIEDPDTREKLRARSREIRTVLERVCRALLENVGIIASGCGMLGAGRTF